MAADLDALPDAVRFAARVLDNGEVMWHAEQAIGAIDALADAGRVVLGLDVRDYAPDDSFVEIPCSSFEPTGMDDVVAGRLAALECLRRERLPGDWVLITWR